MTNYNRKGGILSPPCWERCRGAGACTTKAAPFFQLVYSPRCVLSNRIFVVDEQCLCGIGHN